VGEAKSKGIDAAGDDRFDFGEVYCDFPVPAPRIEYLGLLFGLDVQDLAMSSSHHLRPAGQGLLRGSSEARKVDVPGSDALSILAFGTEVISLSAFM
jgi:hypothetical protein